MDKIDEDSNSICVPNNTSLDCDKNPKEKSNPPVPDGGYGWFVVFGAIFLNFFNQSITSLFGLLFGDHLREMNQEIISAAFITSTNCLVLNFSGFLVGPAIKTFGPRKVAFIGCILNASGLVICAHSTILWHMIVGYSLFVGIGLGLLVPSTFIAIHSYFDKKRGFAIGIALAGTGCGQMIFPHIVRILLENYGFRLTVLIISGLALNGLFGAILYKPIESHRKNKTKLLSVDQYQKAIKKESKSLINKTEMCDEIKNINDFEKQMFEKIIIQKTNINETNFNKNNIESSSSISSISQTSSKLLKEILKKIKDSMDLELLRDIRFCNILFGVALTYTVTMNFTMLFPYFLQHSIGLNKTNTALCMSIMAGTDTFFRLILPILTDKCKLSYRFVFFLGCVGLLISRAVLTESYNYILIIIMTGFYGSAKSATVVNNNLTISDNCNAEKLPGAIGLNMILKGIVMMSIGQFLGWLRDFTRSYTICLHVQNLFILIVIVFWTVEYIYRYIRIYRNNRSNENVSNKLTIA